MGQKLGMAAAFDGAARFDHIDAIGADDGLQTMATTIVVLPLRNSSSAVYRLSDSGSSAAVGSSRSRIGASLSMARAIAMRCL